MTSTEQTDYEAEAIRLGWKRRPDGTWSKGTGRNFKRVWTAEDAVKSMEKPESLREPKSPFQETIRRLADAAMTATHHDIDHRDTEAIHEIESMERKFTNILRGKLK